MKVGLDISEETIFIEVDGYAGTNTTFTMTSRAARAVAGQLIANAEALETALEDGNLGIDDSDAYRCY